MVTAVVWILLGVITAMIAKQRNRNVWYWLLIGFGTGLFGILIIYLLDPLPADKSKVPINKKAMAAIITTCVIFGGVFAVSFYQGFTSAYNSATYNTDTTAEHMKFVSRHVFLQMDNGPVQDRAFDQDIRIDIYNDRVYVHSDTPQLYMLKRKIKTEADHVMYDATDADGNDVIVAVYYHTGGTLSLILTGVDGKNMKVGYTMVKAE
jgi:hypothetical protein